MCHADAYREFDGEVVVGGVDIEGNGVVLQVQAGSVDYAAKLQAVVAGHDDAVFDLWVGLDGHGFNVEVAVEGEGEHVQCGDGEFGVAGHQVFAQIGGDVDDGFVGGVVTVARRVVGVFFTAAHEEGGKCHDGEKCLFHNENY